MAFPPGPAHPPTPDLCLLLPIAPGLRSRAVRLPKAPEQHQGAQIGARNKRERSRAAGCLLCLLCNPSGASTFPQPHEQTRTKEKKSSHRAETFYFPCWACQLTLSGAGNPQWAHQQTASCRGGVLEEGRAGIQPPPHSPGRAELCAGTVGASLQAPSCFRNCCRAGRDAEHQLLEGFWLLAP